MPRYKVTGYATLEFVTWVEAKDEDEARELVQDREADVCIHGSEYAGHEDDEEWILVDGQVDGWVEPTDAEEEI